MNNNVIEFGKTFNFRGDNLKKARVLAGLSITELSARVNISTQSLSKYENQRSTPSSDNLSILSKQLKVPIDFFFSNMFDYQPEKKIGFFRKYSRVSKKDMLQAEMYAELTWTLYSKLSNFVNFPKYQEPVITDKSRDFKKIDRNYISSVASQIREKYNLGSGPVLNLTGFLESLGICINYVDLSDARIDAYTTFYGDTPVIILNSNRISSSRLRFNLAHEFAHILFHSEYIKNYQVGDEYNIIEEEANYFAGCLLVPAEGLIQDLNATHLEFFVSLKSHWVVSVAALVTRSEQLGLISSAHALHLRQQISRNGWRKLEPLDKSIMIEKAVLLESAFNLVMDKQNNSNAFLAEIPFGNNYLKKVVGYEDILDKENRPNLKLLD